MIKHDGPNDFSAETQDTESSILPRAHQSRHFTSCIFHNMLGAISLPPPPPVIMLSYLMEDSMNDVGGSLHFWGEVGIIPSWFEPAVVLHYW
jgi:hypothetical protein